MSFLRVFLRKEWLGRKLIDCLLQILFLIMLTAQGRRHTMNPLPPSRFWAALTPSLSPELVMVYMHYFSWLLILTVTGSHAYVKTMEFSTQKKWLCIDICTLSYFCRQHFSHNG